MTELSLISSFFQHFCSFLSANVCLGETTPYGQKNTHIKNSGDNDGVSSSFHPPLLFGIITFRTLLTPPASDPYWFLRVHHVTCAHSVASPCCCCWQCCFCSSLFFSYTFIFANNLRCIQTLFADGPSWIPASTDRLGVRSYSAARRYWNQIRSHSNVSLFCAFFLFFFLLLLKELSPSFLVAMTWSVLLHTVEAGYILIPRSRKGSRRENREISCFLPPGRDCLVLLVFLICSSEED